LTTSRELGAERAARLRQGREILARKRLHPRVESIRRNLDAVLVLFDPDVRFRKRLDDFVQLLRRQRERSAFGDGGLTPASQSNFEIRGEHAYFIALGLDQYVRQDRDRVLPLNDALEEL
jgi:hypothetical protein